jgi:hypothetical protein
MNSLKVSIMFTKDEIIEKVRHAGVVRWDVAKELVELISKTERERVEDLCMRGTQLAVLVAKAEEREACAKEGWMAASSDCEDRVAAAIRARGTNE